MPLQVIRGVISNNPPFVMSQQGRTNPVVFDIARAICLIKAYGPGYVEDHQHCICYFVIHAFFPIILAPKLWFGEKKGREPRSTSGDCSSPLTLRSNWVCTCAVLHPRINHLFDPLVQPVKLLKQVTDSHSKLSTKSKEQESKLKIIYTHIITIIILYY